MHLGFDIGSGMFQGSGNPGVQPASENVAGIWGILVEDFDEMFVSDVEMQRWLYFKKNSLYSSPGEHYGDMQTRAVLKFNTNGNVHTAAFLNREAYAEDPLI